MNRQASNRLIIDNVQPAVTLGDEGILGMSLRISLNRQGSHARLAGEANNLIKTSNDAFMQRSIEHKESRDPLSSRRSRHNDSLRIAEDGTKILVPMLRQRSKFIERDEEEISVLSCKEKSHPVDVDQLRRSIKEGRSHARGEFSFFIDDLPIKRDVNRNVDLEELVDLEYITEGSSSHIFSAVWQDQPVIVKVLAALFLVLRHPYLLLYCHHELFFIGQEVSYICIISGITNNQIIMIYRCCNWIKQTMQ
jgi:hypothetical protein